MPPKRRKRDCWGYLIPFDVKLPAIPLEFDEIIVGSDADCDIQAKHMGCNATVLSKQHFQLVNSQLGTVVKNNSTKQIFINGLGISRKEESKLPHHAVIAITTLDNRVLVYADKATSDNSNFNPEITKKYVITRSLGSGGYGQVHLIIKKKNHQEFALKITRQDSYAKREAEILRRLSHPCIVKLHKVIINPEQMHLVMDYMRGGDLSQWVNTKKLLTEAQTKLIFYQVTLAVQYLHDKGIGHRDLKPSNILMKNKEPRTLIKVTDFGLAKDEHIHSTMNTRAGSEPYIAPEVTTSQTYSKEVDIWSMGVILFYSLSGTLPFKDVADAKSKKYLTMYISAHWNGISPAALQLVKNLLEINPKKRYNINQVLQDKWLQDENMKMEAQDVMGLPERSTRRRTTAPTNQNQQNQGNLRKLSVPVGKSRECIPPRGVMQHMKSDLDLPDKDKKISFLKRFFKRNHNKT